MLARFQQVDAVIGGQRPVVVLAGAVHAGVGLLMEQADHVVTDGHLLHGLHDQLVVVGGDVGGGEDRGHLVLGRGHLVVLGLGGDAHLPQLDVQILHVGGDPVLDGAEVLVFQFLALGGRGAEEGAAAGHQVEALQIVFLVDQEILLLGADGGR